MTLNDKAIEAWHKKFMKAHPSGELNEEDFIDEFQKLYPLFFSICVNDDSEKVSSEDLIKFLEAVAELEGEDDAADSDAAKFVTNKIMEFWENKSDKEEITKEEITEDEFLACLKENYELCVAFLPITAKKLSDEQIGLIMGRNPGLKRKHILKWHNTFWKEHFGGELTKTKFVDDYKKLYPRGNPAPYCDYVFKSIDKDRTGTINFVEFMEAVAITQPGDPDSRLRLVFAICDKDGSGIINGDEMAKFVKVMAELNKEQVETETSSASSYAQGAQEWTVDEIMKRFQSDRDTTI
ncbi:unnamed protein product [Rotaria magnacalcarata]|uniref:EF-hand domain-containing protein n=1 Tax=Rotaria magnacalcarata TaxID=392030 RepID=A0A816T138_9BILA|nr:unnamed protein product [Rotaria magnacalcarata]